MLQVDKIVNSIFDSITWLLSETESNRVWIVDCGDFDPVFDKIEGREISGVLLTHAHFDHIYGLPELLKCYPNCRIYTNESGRNALADARLNMSLYHETPLTVGGSQVKICAEGDEIPLFDGVNAKVYETPGHHPSCLTFMVEDNVFTGDAYIPKIKVVTNLPKGDKKLAEQSLKRIMKLTERKSICPGHFVEQPV